MKSSTDTLNLGNGQPHESELPHALLKWCLTRAAETQPVHKLDEYVQYGDEVGAGEYREALATWLSSAYGTQEHVRADELVVTAGVSHGLDLCCSVLLEPGDVVFVESPSYFLTFAIFEGLHLRVVPVRTTRDGIDLQHVRELIAGGVVPRAIYTIPTHHNPRATCMSEEARKDLAQLAEEHDVWVLADEVYHLLGFDKPRFRSLAEYSERVLSLSSFSKILAPGLRLGWVHTRSAAALTKLRAHPVLASGGCIANFTTALLLPLLRTPGMLLEHIGTLRGRYRSRAEALCAAVDEHLPEARYVRPQGGYFLWLELGDGVDAEALQACTDAVAFKTGDLCTPKPSAGMVPMAALSHANCVRLCFARLGEDELREGVRRLAKAVRGGE